MSQPQPPAAVRDPRKGLPLGVRAILTLLITAVAGYQLRHFLTWGPEKLAVHELILDDAYFYSVLARNFGRFGFLTLDGEMATNGVQPLWMFLQLALARLLPTVSEAALLARSSWATYLLFCGAAVAAVSRGARRSALAASFFLAGVVLLNVRFQALAVQGVETPLALLLVVLTYLALRWVAASRRASGTEGLRAGTAVTPRGRSETHMPHRCRLATPRVRVVLLGAVAAMVFLTRTDLFWVPLLIGIWLLRGPRGRLGDALAFGAVVVLLTLPYLIHNLASQGHLVPISGRVKQFYCSLAFPTIASYLRSDEWHALLRAFATPFLGGRAALGWSALLSGGVILAAYVALRLHPAKARTGCALRPLAAAFAAHIAFMHLFYRELRPVSAYYFAPDFLCALGALSAGVAALAVRRAAVARLAALLLTAAALALGLLTWQGRELHPVRYWEQRVALAHDLNRALPADARVAAFWPGVFAQFSHCLVTPLDGVVGSATYFRDYVRPHRELDYLLERRRPHLILWLPGDLRSFLEQERIGVATWARLGMLRLWERRTALRIREVRARIVNEEEGGWFLLEIVPAAVPGRPTAPIDATHTDHNLSPVDAACARRL